MTQGRAAQYPWPTQCQQGLMHARGQFVLISFIQSAAPTAPTQSSFNAKFCIGCLPSCRDPVDARSHRPMRRLSAHHTIRHLGFSKRPLVFSPRAEQNTQSSLLLEGESGSDTGTSSPRPASDAGVYNYPRRTESKTRMAVSLYSNSPPGIPQIVNSRIV